MTPESETITYVYFSNKNIDKYPRCKTIRNIKSNFHNMYSSLLCPLCKATEDTPDHLMMCTVLQNMVPLNNPKGCNNKDNAAWNFGML